MSVTGIIRGVSDIDRDAWTPERIQRLRKALGDSTGEFAIRFGRSRRTIEDWEQEGRPKPDLFILMAMEKLEARVKRRAAKKR